MDNTPKMTVYHKDLQKRWHTLSLLEQLTNVGSEVEREEEK